MDDGRLSQKKYKKIMIRKKRSKMAQLKGSESRRKKWLLKNLYQFD